jgi:hypothetical protein
MNNLTVPNNQLLHQQSQSNKPSSSYNEDNIPVTITALHVPKSILQSKKLSDISEKLPEIDKIGIFNIAKHFNDTPKGSVISLDIIEKAIKGLDYNGQDFPKETHADNVFKDLDKMIEDATKKSLALNTAFLVLDPSITLSRLPIPVLKSQKKSINDFFLDDQKIVDFMHDIIPTEGKNTFKNNIKILQEDTPSNLQSKENSLFDKLTPASRALKDDMVSLIEKELADLYQLTALRLLATLGHHSTGVTDVHQSIKMPEPSKS